MCNRWREKHQHQAGVNKKSDHAEPPQAPDKQFQYIVVKIKGVQIQGGMIHQDAQHRESAQGIQIRQFSADRGSCRFAHGRAALQGTGKTGRMIDLLGLHS